MANRYTTQFYNTLQKGVNSILARVTFGAAGAPTIDRSGFNSEGVVSVTRNGTGLYTIVLGTFASSQTAASLDVYYKLLNVNHFFDETGNGGGAPASPGMFLTANNVAVPVGSANACSFQVQFNAAGVATDPGSGEAVMLEIILKNSTAP